MKIIKINNENRYLNEIVNIYYDWWAKDKNIKYNDLYNSYLNKNTLPIIYALIINDTLIGMYELNEKDFIQNKEYTPYLANVYILEKYRGLGYSKCLIEHAIKKTKKMGYNKLYLHSKHENYYEKFGFKFKEKVNTEYGEKNIYVRKIKESD